MSPKQMSNSAVFLLFLSSLNSFSSLNTEHNGYYSHHQKAKALKIIVLLNSTLSYKLLKLKISIYCSRLPYLPQLTLSAVEVLYYIWSNIHVWDRVTAVYCNISLLIVVEHYQQ